MRPTFLFSIFIGIALISILGGCSKAGSTDDGGPDDGGDDLTGCEKAAHDWGQIWSVKTEQTGLTGVTPDNDLMDIWGSDAQNIYVVGFSGIILHYDGNAWTQMESGTTENLRGVWGYVLKDVNGVVVRHDVFAVGENGVILRYNGTTWQSQLVFLTDPTKNNSKSAVTGDFNDVGGIAPTSETAEPTVVAVGVGSNGKDSLIASYDSTSKTFEEMRQVVTVHHGLDPDGNQKPDTTEFLPWSNNHLNGVFGESATDFVAVGNDGAVVNIDAVGLTCSSVYIPGVLVHLNGLWGRWGELYAVGNEGTVARRNSGTWTKLDISLPVTSLRSNWSIYQESCGPIPEGGTEAQRPNTYWHIFVGWDGTLYFDHDDVLCPLGSITDKRLDAVWGFLPRPLSERTTTKTDTQGNTITTWVCDPMDIWIAGVDGTLLRLTDQQGL